VSTRRPRSTKTNIGSREIYLKALEDGSVQVVPEYTGALALFYDKSFDKTDPNEVYDALKAALPKNLTVLAKSAAEDNDSIVVTKETAAMLGGVTTLSGLKDKAGTLTLGAPPEFQTRPQGIPGLEKTYGVVFKDYVPLKGQALVQALKNGQVQAANIFSTDPQGPGARAGAQERSGPGGQHLLDGSRHRGERLRDDRGRQEALRLTERRASRCCRSGR